MKLVHGVVFSSLLALSSPLLAAEYIVKFRDLGGVKNVNESVRVMDVHSTGNLAKVDLAAPKSSKAEAELVADLLADPNVEYVVPNIKLHRFEAPPSAEALRDQWAIAKVNAERAWQMAGNRGSRNVIVAVIDTGVDYNHESLKPNMIAGYNFKDNNSDPMDKTGPQNPGHGTHCAGIVGGSGIVDNGIIGLSPELSMMPLRFLGEDGSGDLMTGIKAIDYAIEKKARVISASWGATVPRAQAAPLIEAVKRADDAGVIFVAAAANDGRNNDSTDVFPANTGLPNTITVAASGPNDEKPSWSNFGKGSVHVAAPGLNIMSTLPSNKYGNLSGTSMATPLVSGLVAFLLAQDPDLTGAEVRAILQTTGAKVAIETACNCRVDAAAATEVVMKKPMLVVPAAATLKVADTAGLAFTAMNAKAPLTFASSNTAAATIDSNGKLVPVAVGTTMITVTDADGKTAKSLDVNVVDGSSNNPTPGECPLGDPVLCQILCQILPTAPWCSAQ